MKANGLRRALRSVWWIWALQSLLSLLYLHQYLWFQGVRLLPQEANTFTLVFFGDPQLEGDARRFREGLYGQLACWLSDQYQRHVVRSVLRHAQRDSQHPARLDHLVVLGDLFSYQYLSQAEFDDRLRRYQWIFDTSPFHVPVATEQKCQGGLRVL
jgi:hypothetical protein